MAVVLARLRTARFGQMRELSVEFGLTVNRLHYLRYKLLGMKFSPEDRRLWLHAQRQIQKAPPKRNLIPKREGIAREDHLGDWTAQEQDALDRLGEEEETERRIRPELLAQAKAGSIGALLRLKERYRLRLPLVEDSLSPEERALLPWLGKDNGDAG
jgi:hypothetical protein